MTFGLIFANLMGDVDGTASRETAQTAEEAEFHGEFVPLRPTRTGSREMSNA